VNKTILSRLAALESRQAPPADDGSRARLHEQLDLIASRLRERPDYRPSDQPLAEIMAACRAAKAAYERQTAAPAASTTRF
jgi:hypothetical protein